MPEHQPIIDGPITAERYAPVGQALHWLTALMVFLTIPLAWVMVNLPTFFLGEVTFVAALAVLLDCLEPKLHMLTCTLGGNIWSASNAGNNK